MNALARTLLLPLVVGALAVAAQPAAAAKLDAPWTGSGPGTLKPVPAGADADAQLDYQAPGAYSGSWSYSAVAGATRAVPVEYQASGFYGWYAVSTKLERFVVRGGKEISTLQLVAQGPTNCCDAPSGGFTYKGKTTFEVEKGDVYGLRMSGSHFTGGPTMGGSIVLREVDSTPPAITPVVTGQEGANGFHTGPVKVEWKLADDDSRILSQKGCEPVTVSEDTAGKVLTCTAASRGGSAARSVTVKLDSVAPELSVPAAVAVQAATSGGAAVSYKTSAGDNVDPEPTVSCTPASGSVLAVGTTSVSCTATDAAGHSTTKAFDALVVAPSPATVLSSSVTQPGLKQINAVLAFRFKIAKNTTRIVQLQVKNIPAGATVLVKCKGTSCPKKLRGRGLKLTSKGSSVSLATLIKTGLRSGTTLNVMISSPGAITTIKTLTVRKGKSPVVK